MADEARTRRIAENIRGSVTRALERTVKDPRLGFLTITEVKVTRDLQHATVYYTVMGDEAQRRETARALRSATGLIRSEVGKSLSTRLTPTLTFEEDAVPEAAASIEDKLREARERDAAIAEQRAGKAFAGEADPYRRPADEEDVVDADDADWDNADVDDLEVDDLAPGGTSVDGSSVDGSSVDGSSVDGSSVDGSGER